MGKGDLSYFMESNMRKIKVLQTIRQGKIGGGESHLLNLVENLDKNKFDCRVLSFTEGPMMSRLEEMGVPADVIYTETPFDVRVWKKVKRYLQEHQFDLIHAHGTRSNSNVIWAAQRLGIPVIYTIHGWSFHQDQNFIVKKMRVLGEQYLTKRTALNISVSPSNQKAGQQLIPGFKSRIIHYGVDQNRFNRSASYPDVRTELKIPEGKELLLFIARFTHHKQPLALLKAYIELTKVNPHIHLLMVGDGDQRAEAEMMVAKARIQDRITFEKFRLDVPAVLNAADIFILPSLWEGLPIGLLEAMTMGKAIIASNVDGTCDVIEHQKNGILVNTDSLVQNLIDAIQNLSGNKAKQQQLGFEAVKSVEEYFTVGRMTAEIENVYQDIVNKSTNN
jgi:glycosyltransferase involved in cell wall biosynthesis